MTFTIITLFPQFFDSIFNQSILKRAKDHGKIKINLIDLRSFGIGPHKMVDDRPYGGGAGMVLRVDVLIRAIESQKKKSASEKIILLDPKGKVFKQEIAEELADFEHLILVCGHYEGFDERIREYVDYELSVGDYILSGGELAAAIVTESVARLVPGVLKKEDATHFESFSKGTKRMLEYPHYTRPADFRGKTVPEVLLSGNFKAIEEYRMKKAKETTKVRRPDLNKS
jgi:tRNA (guanine37-N1)-methyltransferase